MSETHSRYGLIVAAERGSQKSVFENGVLVASVPDRLAAEEAVHLAMLEHPRPADVLLLGGTLGGAVTEILKHPTVAASTAWSLDPALVGAAERAFGDAMTGALRDPRVSVHYADARFFVKRTSGRYDVVIVNIPDPTTAQANRFYTTEFAGEVASVLARGGVAAFSVSSAEEYVGPELATLLACVRRSLEGRVRARPARAREPVSLHRVRFARLPHAGRPGPLVEGRGADASTWCTSRITT